ncbi:MAG: hypothetical protein SH848_22000 [Saprospiraceae bacterium]|nr:hypothetical protein [Saprospiraceae bacterium]MDZ4706618.1 hypothetical protein [Saprospiraceae bacterium]
MKKILLALLYPKTLRFQMLTAFVAATLLLFAANSPYFSLHKRPGQPTAAVTLVNPNTHFAPAREL